MFVKKATRRDYDAFNWLPLARWNIDTLLGPSLGQKIMCKICDEYISIGDSETHVNRHVTVRKRQLSDDRKKAKELRLEKLRIARQLKAEEMQTKKEK